MPVVRRNRTNVVSRRVAEEIEGIDVEFPEPTHTECCVCYSSNKIYLQTTNCGHTLCRLCYKKIYEKCCPLCRVEIDPKLYEYKKPLHIPSSRHRQIKMKLEIFFSRRMFLQDCKGAKYNRYLTAMIKYKNLFYFKGKYYPVYNIDAYWQYYYEYTVQDVVSLYTYMLVAAGNKVPLDIRKQIIDNVRQAIQYY